MINTSLDLVPLGFFPLPTLSYNSNFLFFYLFFVLQGLHTCCYNTKDEELIRSLYLIS